MRLILILRLFSFMIDEVSTFIVPPLCSYSDWTNDCDMTDFLVLLSTLGSDSLLPLTIKIYLRELLFYTLH